MPIFMDRHDLPEITAKDVAKAHKRDLEIQDQFNCKAITYWFDETRGTAFCLIEAPDKQSVVALHNHSHGMIPGNIIEVNSKLVETFLGRIKNPEEGIEGMNQSVYRTIMAMELQDIPILKHQLGADGFYTLLRSSNKLVEKLVHKFAGKLIFNNEMNWIASFASTSSAVDCALDINRQIPDLNVSSSITFDLCLSTGLSAGDPVTEQEGLFGEAIQLAKRLSRTVRPKQIVASHLIQKLFKEEELKKPPTNKRFMILQTGEERFLNNLMDTMEKDWNQQDLTNTYLTKKLGLSESQLYRKLSSLTGKTPTEFIKEIRLKRAAQFIEDQNSNISEIAYQAGFNNPSYFSKCFRNRFGIAPSTYSKIVN